MRKNIYLILVYYTVTVFEYLEYALSSDMQSILPLFSIQTDIMSYHRQPHTHTHMTISDK